MNFPKVNILSTPCSITCRTNLLNSLEKWALSKPGERSLSVDFTNIHIVTLRDMCDRFSKLTEGVDLFIPDSQILSWCAYLIGGKGQRIYGPEFLDYASRTGSNKIRHYFLGGSVDCLNKLLDRTRKKNEQINIVGSHNGYFGPDDEQKIIEELQFLKPHFIWVGLGTPKQQEFIAKWKESVNGGVWLAVGFAFDVNAGTKKDAPGWLGPLGLIWFYRLISEPRRLFTRYFKYNTQFLIRFARQIFLKK